MPEIAIRDRNNKPVGTISLPDELFAGEPKTGAVHNAVVNYLANQRQGTHATKTRGLVSGGGKKPWKQKHTGRARSGSNRSPLWRGGGTIFGPQPRDYSYSLPRRARQVALRSVLSAKLSGGEIAVIDDLAFEKPRTREMVAILRNLGLTGTKTLVVTEEKNENVILSSRNIPGLSVSRVADLNTYTVAAHGMLLFTRRAMDKLAEAGAL